MPRNRRSVDRALRIPQRGVRRATTLVLLLGIAVLIWALSTPERRRQRAIARLELGAGEEQIAQLLGTAGAACSGADLEHLLGMLPPDWSPATRERALAALQAQTVERWVYPLDPDGAGGCTPRSQTTEIGLGPDRRVLWFVPVTGRTRIVLPADFPPGETDDSAAALRD